MTLFIRESVLVELLLAVSVVTLVAEGAVLPFLVEFAHHCLVFMRVRCRHLVPDRLFHARLRTCSFWWVLPVLACGAAIDRLLLLLVTLVSFAYWWGNLRTTGQCRHGIFLWAVAGAGRTAEWIVRTRACSLLCVGAFVLVIRVCTTLVNFYLMRCQCIARIVGTWWSFRTFPRTAVEAAHGSARLDIEAFVLYADTGQRLAVGSLALLGGDTGACRVTALVVLRPMWLWAGVMHQNFKCIFSQSILEFIDFLIITGFSRWFHGFSWFLVGLYGFSR